MDLPFRWPIRAENIQHRNVLAGESLGLCTQPKTLSRHEAASAEGSTCLRKVVARFKRRSSTKSHPSETEKEHHGDLRLCTSVSQRLSIARRSDQSSQGAWLLGDPGRKEERHSLQDRTELKTLLDFVRQGDILAVTRIDRIARSTADLFEPPYPRGQGRVAEGDRAAHRHVHGPGAQLDRNSRDFFGTGNDFAASARWNPSVASRRSTGRSPSTNAPTKVARRRSSRMRCRRQG